MPRGSNFQVCSLSKCAYVVMDEADKLLYPAHGRDCMGVDSKEDCYFH